MKTYTVVAGVPGAGVNSFVGVLEGITKNIKTVSDNTLAADYIKNNNSLIHKADLSDNSTAQMLCNALGSGFYIKLRYIGLNTLQEHLKRIKNRVEKGGHNIPVADVLKRFDTRFENMAAVLPYCNVAVFYDNENGFEEVAEYSNGDLIVFGSDAPDWIKEFKEYLLSN